MVSDNKALQARRAAATPRGVSVAAPFFVARAENAELWDVEGRRFVDFAGGIAGAIQRSWEYLQAHRPGLRIEVEARSLDEVRQVLEAGEGRVFRVMFDNFSPDEVRTAMALVDGRMETEASGGIGLDNIVDYASTGVDWVSVGGLIHQAASLDLSLKAES